MTSREYDECQNKMRRYEKLKDGMERITEAIVSLDSISGNTSEIRPATLTIKANGKEAILIGSWLTDSQIKDLIQPALRKIRDTIISEMQAI